MTNTEYDAMLRQQYGRFCGVDEAGRGPLAGPVCAAAVILDPNRPIEGLNDSKKLTEKKREALFEEILEKADGYAITYASVEDIERMNILQATFKAMTEAVDILVNGEVSVRGECTLQTAVIDGNRVPPQLRISGTCVVKGDALSASVGAASILAKVSRDRLMQEMDRTYPGYGFAVHKGYGTKAHTEAILRLGPCPIHRPSFLRKLLERS